MALINSNANTISTRTKVYKLCRVCNSQGKRGNPLVSCTSCSKYGHTSLSCSSSLNLNCNKTVNIDNADDNNKKQQFLCNMCKVQKRLSSNLTVSITQAINRRSSQSSNVVKGRGSTSQITTPPLTTQHITGRAVGSGTSSSTANTKDKENICGVPSHVNLQQQIDKIKSTLDELQIQFCNNNTLLNHLKQENQRLTGLVNDLQNAHYSVNSIESSHPLSTQPINQHSSIRSSVSDNHIYTQLNNKKQFITNSHFIKNKGNQS